MDRSEVEARMNSWRSLFVKGPPIQPRGRAIPAGAQEATGAFITPQTLTTFPGATAAVSIISHVVAQFITKYDFNTVTSFIAILVGIIILIINVSDPRLKPRGSRAWIIALTVGFINACCLVVAALGVKALQN